MTLVEVLAGLVVLGTLLASLAIARGRFSRQWADADRKLAAVRAVDAMVTDWTDMPGSPIPVNREGALPGAPNCVWRTHLIPDANARSLAAAIVRLEVFDRSAATRQLRAVPLLTLDLLVHQTTRAPATRPTAEVMP